MQYVFIICTLFTYVYEDSDSLIVDNDSLMICGQHEYNILVDIRNNGVLLVRQWSPAADSLGRLEINAPLIILRAGSLINGSNRGPLGGYLNAHPWGYGSGGGGAGGVSGGAGGGGGYGGNGGMGGDLYGGTGGVLYGTPADTLIEPGSGGGAGRLSVVDGIGGNGGALVSLRGFQVLVDSSRIEVMGQRGSDGSLEAGAGGSGGGILIRADSIAIYHSELFVDGACGGDASFGGGGGGAGGRIKIFYGVTLDTIGNIMSASGGSAGAGLYGNPQSGENGTVYFHQIVGITSFCEVPVRDIHFPNPAKTTLTITTDRTPCSYELYDITGRRVMCFGISERSMSIDLTHVPAGVYLLKRNDERLTSTIIVVK